MTAKGWQRGLACDGVRSPTPVGPVADLSVRVSALTTSSPGAGRKTSPLLFYTVGSHRLWLRKSAPRRTASSSPSSSGVPTGSKADRYSVEFRGSALIVGRGAVHYPVADGSTGPGRWLFHRRFAWCRSNFYQSGGPRTVSHQSDLPEWVRSGARGSEWRSAGRSGPRRRRRTLRGVSQSGELDVPSRHPAGPSRPTRCFRSAVGGSRRRSGFGCGPKHRRPRHSSLVQRREWNVRRRPYSKYRTGGNESRRRRC